MGKRVSGFSRYLRQDVVRAIKKIISELKQSNLEYTSVLVFGSQARGRATSASDIDLCIVVPDSLMKAEPEHERRVRFCIAKLLLNTDVIVVSKSDFDKNKLSPLLHEIRTHHLRVA